MQGARILYEASQPTASVAFGKYELIELIGHGGMAEVWKARMVGPAGFNRTVVVKRVLPQLAQDPQFAKMFVSEARLSARLTHPNIVQVFELGEFAGQYFLSMEYVRGHDLLHVLRMLRGRSAPPPIELGTVVVRDVCRALGYAHTLTTEDGTPLKIIHRDVTPSNVMVSYDGCAKLLDFGIAKAFGGAGELVTRAGELKGKFAYMAPEQLQPHAVIDHRADLFAAGVVLYETLTGTRLFKGENDVETLHLVREAKIDPPSSRNAQVSPELDRICMRALARDLSERYPDCEQMAHELDAVAHHLSCGPEDVKALMRGLFPSEVSGNTSLPTSSVPVSSSVQLSMTTPTPPPRRRWRSLALGGVLVAAAAVGGWVWVGGRLAAPPPATAARSAAPAAAAPAGATAGTAVEPAAAAEPTAAPPPSVPDAVSVIVRSTPPRAEVFLDDEAVPRGRTPVTLVLRRSSDVHQLTLKLPGFPPKMIPLRCDADSRVELALVQSPAPAPPPAPRPAVARPAPHVVKHVAAPPPRAARPAAESPHPINDPDGQDVLDPFKQ